MLHLILAEGSGFSNVACLHMSISSLFRCNFVSRHSDHRFTWLVPYLMSKHTCGIHQNKYPHLPKLKVYPLPVQWLLVEFHLCDPQRVQGSELFLQTLRGFLAIWTQKWSTPLIFSSHILRNSTILFVGYRTHNTSLIQLPTCSDFLAQANA